jgi:DNA-3-methyladenine glycosylase
MARLPRSFYDRDTRTVARELLGMCMVRVLVDGQRLSGIIVEAEAYRPDDPASHSFRGKTERTAPMFMRPGRAYVYFTYGMHYCFNVVTEPEGVAAAVLIRALQPQEGIDVMRANRAAGKFLRDVDLCRGPGRLCQALQIDRAFSGYDMQQRGSALFIERGPAIPNPQVRTSPRIGVSGSVVAKSIAWRWFVADNLFVSR